MLRKMKNKLVFTLLLLGLISTSYIIGKNYHFTKIEKCANIAVENVDYKKVQSFFGHKTISLDHHIAYASMIAFFCITKQE
jgi:hypothetical protein